MTDRPNAAHTLEAFFAAHQGHAEQMERAPLPVKLPGAPRYVVYTCPPCGKSFTTLALEEQRGDPMARKKVDATAPIQPPLVKLTDEEVAEHQQRLPKLIGELKAMKTVHAGKRVEMKKERSDLQNQIDNIAQQLEDNGR